MFTLSLSHFHSQLVSRWDSGNPDTQPTQMICHTFTLSHFYFHFHIFTLNLKAGEILVIQMICLLLCLVSLASPHIFYGQHFRPSGLHFININANCHANRDGWLGKGRRKPGNCGDGQSQAGDTDTDKQLKTNSNQLKTN